MEDVKSMEVRIQQAMRSRVQYFKDQADSLTFEGVRRLLEKDLVLETYALDVHKKYVKQMIEKYLNGSEDAENVSKDSENIKSEQVKEEKREQPDEHDMKEEVKETGSKDDGKLEDSPVMGLLTAKSGNSEIQANEKDNIPNEVMVKKAIWKRAAYFRSKSEEITVAGVRRLLEEDLELDKYSLDSFKKLISKLLDEVLNSPEPESKVHAKKKSKVNSKSSKAVKIGSKGSTDSSDSGSDNVETEVKPKKKFAQKGKTKTSEGLNKRKRPAKETKVSKEKQSTAGEEETKASGKKQSTAGEETSEETNNTEDGQDVSESEKSEEKSVKKKEVVGPAYGKKVEHLKSIIKSCGMSVAPSMYKKAKQFPEDEREAFIINELQEILSKEGLSKNPTEKEIKEVRRRKERAKELEGIDTSNIVLSSRRRSTSIFVATPKPEAPVDSDQSDSEESEESQETDNDDGEEEDDDVHDSVSEEVHEEDDNEDSD